MSVEIIKNDTFPVNPRSEDELRALKKAMKKWNDEPKIDDGGERISYGEGKAIREPSTGKGRYDLISPFATRRLAKWYELGARKYSDRNWEKGIPFSRYIDSAKRHLDKFIMGMDDEDHLAAAAWNVFAIMHHQELGQTDLDDMPHYERLHPDGGENGK